MIDTCGRAHDAPHLMIVGGLTISKHSGYNPTELIEAHARFAAACLAKSLHAIAV